jgi:hypothetical protein
MGGMMPEEKRRDTVEQKRNRAQCQAQEKRPDR